MAPVAALWLEIAAWARRYERTAREQAADSALSLEWNLAPPATEEAIATLESAIGVAVPDDYRASLLVHDGFVLPEVPGARRMEGLSVAESLEAKKRLDRLLASAEWQAAWRRDLIPIVCNPAITTVLDATSGNVFDLYVDEHPEEALCLADGSYIERLRSYRDALANRR